MPSWVILGKAGAATARVRLRPGECVKAEPDALITSSEGVELGAAMDAGLLSGLMRSFAGESLFSQTLTATHVEGDCVLGAPTVGDVEIMHVTHHEPLMLAKGAFLASDASIDISTTTQRGIGNTLLSGTGLFVLRASGQGTLAVAAHGAILSFTLAPGEVRAVDNGHLVAWSEGMRFEMRAAGATRRTTLFGAAFNSAASGEGFMCFFTGPGNLWLQTHKPPPPPPGSDGTSSGRRGGGSASSSGSPVRCCMLCLTLLLMVGAAITFLFVVPSQGGHWVPSDRHDGSYRLVWDPPPPSRYHAAGRSVGHSDAERVEQGRRKAYATRGRTMPREPEEL